jgi:DNA sulfur modification protein DndB
MQAATETPARPQERQSAVRPAFEYVFPAIRGIQAGSPFFVSMCPLRLISKVFLFDEDELLPEIRAQRALNRARLPEIARYIVDNPDSYVFSALTASIDGNTRFETFGEIGHEDRLGVLHVEMDARFVINDGQHRRAAIELALRERPELADESIAVVFFSDPKLERCQQLFADLNRYAVRPSTSIGVLYDHRDDLAALTRLVVLKSPTFRDLVDMQRSTLSPRSRKLFTLSALYASTKTLLRDQDPDLDAFATASAYWEAVATHIPEWRAVRELKLSSGEVRRDFIHSHGVVLHALGHAGNTLIGQDPDPDSYDARLAPLSEIDWSRANSKLWEGRALIGGHVSKASRCLTLTTNVILRQLGLPLNAEQERAEEALNGDR